jgi:SAM-dependent methyltransferase
MRTRSLEPERLDLEVPPPDQQARVIGYLSFVNRRLGGASAVARRLGELREPATVLDVAAGGGDLVRELARRNPRVRPIALDRSDWAIGFASGVPRVRADAFRLPFADRSVDFVISTHFFHHLTDDQAVAALREFDRVARRGIVVNDLLRTRRALLWIRLLTLWANPYVKADGPRSVRKAFTVPEVEALARRAGLGWLSVERHFGHRFTLAGRR